MDNWPSQLLIDLLHASPFDRVMPPVKKSGSSALFVSLNSFDTTCIALCAVSLTKVGLDDVGRPTRRQSRSICGRKGHVVHLCHELKVLELRGH